MSLSDISTRLKTSSPYFYVNEDSALPTNGGTYTFFEGIPNIGELTSLQIMVVDPNAHLSISDDNGTESHSFGPYYYVGSGLILASQCEFSYKTVTTS